MKFLKRRPRQISIACGVAAAMLLTGCASQIDVRMHYAAKPPKKVEPAATKALAITRFADMRFEKTNLCSDKDAAFFIKPSEDLGAWVSKALQKELNAYGYQAKLSNAAETNATDYSIGGEIHLATFNRGGRTYFFKLVFDVIVKKQGVVVLNKQYYAMKTGSPGGENTANLFEEALREGFGEVRQDLTSLFAHYEGADHA